MGPNIEYEGVTFENLRAAICASYFLTEGMSQEEWQRALGYVIPMQHNFENPITPGSQDTWIQYMVDEDDRLTQDYNTADTNETHKVARITLRFLGVRAEVWAKAFHHLIKRKSVAGYFREYCNAEMLDYISPIVPMPVDYFGAGNTTMAHDLTFNLCYMEVMQFDREPLDFISIPEGEITGSLNVKEAQSA